MTFTDLIQSSHNEIVMYCGTRRLEYEASTQEYVVIDTWLGQELYRGKTEGEAIKALQGQKKEKIL